MDDYGETYKETLMVLLEERFALVGFCVAAEELCEEGTGSQQQVLPPFETTAVRDTERGRGGEAPCAGGRAECWDKEPRWITERGMTYSHCTISRNSCRNACVGVSAGTCSPRRLHPWLGPTLSLRCIPARAKRTFLMMMMVVVLLEDNRRHGSTGGDRSSGELCGGSAVAVRSVPRNGRVWQPMRASPGITQECWIGFVRHMLIV